MQTTEGSGDASSEAEEKWPWTTGLTAQGKRIMAYRAHGRGYRCAVETEKGNEVFRLRSGMECGGLEVKQYLTQEGIRQFAPPETGRKWTFEDRDGFKGIWRMAVSEYKTSTSSLALILSLHESTNQMTRIPPHAKASIPNDFELPTRYRGPSLEGQI